MEKNTKNLFIIPLVFQEHSIKQYNSAAFTLAKGVVTNNLIMSLKNILTEWSNKTILDWKERNLINDIQEKLPFEYRLAILWEKAGRPQYISSPRQDLICEELFN